MRTILGKPTSINVRKVLWLCDELAIPYTLEPWGSGYRSTDTPEFRARNPNAMVPVLVEDDFVLWESGSICRYLAATPGGDALYPADPRRRAIVEQWMDWQATELNTAWRYAFTALVRASHDHQDPRAIAASIASWNRHMAILDDRLAGTGAFAAGADVTLADIVLGLSTHRWLLTPMERPALPAVARYYDRLGERAAFRAHSRADVP
jgi:glutathione S-transferase